MTRAFHILEFNFSGRHVKYQFGIANPDYPAIVKKKEFVLDLDSYIFGLHGFNDAIECVNNCHSKIQELFEDSITDATRSLMN